MPFILLVMAVLAIVYTFIANKTVLGRHVYMVGGNPKAAKLSGVRTDLVMLAVYTNMAFLSTIAGFVVAGRLNAASPKAGTGYRRMPLRRARSAAQAVPLVRSWVPSSVRPSWRF